jgi:hypothetical protein
LVALAGKVAAAAVVGVLVITPALAVLAVLAAMGTAL